MRVLLQPQGPEDETKGVEMEQDFDGEMHDVPENPEGDDDAAEEEGDDERLEQEMGEGEEDDEVVDEKLWGEDEERPNDPDAKTEKDAPMKVELPTHSHSRLARLWHVYVRLDAVSAWRRLVLGV